MRFGTTRDLMKLPSVPKFIPFILLSTLACGAQERPSILIGASGGESFGNLSLGLTVEVEAPIAHYFELDLRDTFDPLESHISLGSGYDNIVTVEPVLWIKHGFGLDGRVDWSQYHVTKVSKHGTYVYGGISTRGVWLDAPVRVMLDYFREVNNGIYGHGIETSHLQGGSMYLEAQVGCSKHVCYYTTLEMAVGGLLEQGNPQCDGSFSRVTCPRTRTVSGSGIMGVLIEFFRSSVGRGL
jgi:hypothetical protein